MTGEFRLPLSKLGEWAYHPKLGSREQGEHFHALLLTAAEPDDLPPIEVLPEIDGEYPIVDGRYIYFALKKAHERNEDVEVRCVLYNGTEAQAVQAVCDTTVGTIEASAMEKAQALYNHQHQPARDRRTLSAPHQRQGQQHAHRRPDAGGVPHAVRHPDRARPGPDLVRQRYPDVAQGAVHR